MELAAELKAMGHPARKGKPPRPEPRFAPDPATVSAPDDLAVLVRRWGSGAIGGQSGPNQSQMILEATQPIIGDSTWGGESRRCNTFRNTSAPIALAEEARTASFEYPNRSQSVRRQCDGCSLAPTPWRTADRPRHSTPGQPEDVGGGPTYEKSPYSRCVTSLAELARARDLRSSLVNR